MLKAGGIGAILLVCLLSVQASILEFDQIDLHLNEYISIGYGMYKKGEAPLKNDDDAEVECDLNFKFDKVPKNNSASPVEVILFHSDVKDYIGKKIRGDRHYCCWQDDYEDGKCDPLGRLIIQDKAWNDLPTLIEYWSVHYDDTSPNITQESSLKKQFILNKSGVWRFWIFTCGEEKKSKGQTVVVDGTLTYISPYGQTPGDYIGYLPTFWILWVGYLVAGLLWIIATWRYKDGIMLLQHFILGVIALACLDCFISALDYSVYNSTGKISLAFNVLGVLLSTFKNSSSVVVLLLICMGWTVIRPDLEPSQRKTIIIFGVSYWIINFLYRLSDMFTYTPQTYYINIPMGWLVFIAVVATIMDFIFIVLVIHHLTKSAKAIIDRKDSAKWQMFKQLGLALIIIYIVSFIFLIIYLGALVGNAYDDWWRGWFFFGAYYYIVHFVGGVFIAYLWRPTANNTRYAYIAQLDNEVDLPKIESQSKMQNDKTDDETD